MFQHDHGGTAPLKQWLAELKKTEHRSYAKCLEVITALRREGERLGFPRSKNLGNGILELRTKNKKVKYRMFYFFCGKGVACISHGWQKGGKGGGTDKQQNAEIELAGKRRTLVLSNLARYSTADWSGI